MKAINPKANYHYRAAQREASSLAGMLSVVKFFSVGKRSGHLSKSDIEAIQDGLSRPVVYMGGRLSVITYENHHGTDLNYTRNPDLAYEKLVTQSYEVDRVNNIYSVRNPLAARDYYKYSTESGEHEQYSGSGQRNAKRGLEVLTNKASSCGDDWFFNHKENQQRPDLAYERLVSQRYEVNRLSFSELDNLPTDSGLPPHLYRTERPSQNKHEIIGVVNLVNIIHLVHSITGSNPVYAANDFSPVQAKKNNRISYSTSQLKSKTGIPVLGYSPISLSAIFMILPSSSRALAAPSRMWVIVSSAETMASSAVPPIWRRAISPCMAATINPAVDSSVSFTASIATKTSCGTLAVTDCDLLFLGPVAIIVASDKWCKTVYTKSNYIKPLTCKPPLTINTYTLSTGGAQVSHKIAKPSSARTLTGPLTKPLSEVTVMAKHENTQTHSKFTWRFLTLSVNGQSITHITAATEREAREQSPAGCVMVFAGRLPAQEVRHA